jgi:rhamnulose-1-phosphate aldolase
LSDDAARDRGDNLRAFLTELGAVGWRLWERGWAECNAGNLSMVCPPLPHPLMEPSPDDPPIELSPAVPELGGQLLLITATGSRLREVRSRPAETVSLLAVASGGHRALPLRLGPGAPPPPTSELGSHVAVLAAAHRDGSGERAIVHTHPDDLIVMSHDPSLSGERELSERLWRMIPEATLLLERGVGLVPYRPPGSPEQALATSDALSRRPVVVWDRHGAIATGRDLEHAFDRIDAADKAARLYLQARRAGFEPRGLDPEHLDELRRRFFG